MAVLPNNAKTGDKKEITTGDGRKVMATKTDKGWVYSSPYGSKGGGKGKKANPTDAAAARAVVNAVKNAGEAVGSAVSSMKLGGNKNTPASPAPAASSSGGSGGGSPAPAKTAAPPKPGAVYRKTRALAKSEKENAPRRYETPEQTKARMDKSAFDMSMSGADVKKYRKAYLAKHPAAAKAVAKGTMSMGDINMTVRRLKKKGNMDALGVKAENAS